MNLVDHFLVAMPNLHDSYFNRSVIYMCEHDEKEGSMGVMLTQSTDLSVAELVAKINFMMAKAGKNYPEEMVLNGGPVSVEQGFILHTDTPTPFEQSVPVNDHIMLTTSPDVIETIGTYYEPRKYKIALGCATWKPEQLEREIRENSWIVVPANDHILFDVPHDRVWAEASQQLGINHGNLSNFAGCA